MSVLDSKIDDLYKGPLDAFISARGALAKTLGGADARRVRTLAKPTVVPWAVNQVYWRARPTFDRLAKAGQKLRTLQIAALKGKSGDLRGATADQRKAIADAVATAAAFAAQAGLSPGADALTRTFEALSLATALPEPEGRMTKPLQPAGFEALSGMSIPARIAAPAHARTATASHPSAAGVSGAGRNRPEADRVSAGSAGRRAAVDRDRARAERAAQRSRIREERRREREAAAAARRRNTAEADLERARSAEARARKAWEQAKAARDDAEARLDRISGRVNV